MIKIHPIKAFKDNYIWAMINAASSTVSVVDPGDAAPVIEFINQHHLILKTILITHKHNDHCGGVKILQEKYHPEIIGPQHSDILATKQIKDGDSVFLADLEIAFQVLEIPGHTLEHIAFYCESEKILFCGDTLFSAGCGRLFEGTYDQMWHSLEKILALPEDTKIYCAHEYTQSNLRFSKEVEPDNHDIDVYVQQVSELRENDQPTLPSLLSFEKKVNPFLRVAELNIIKRMNQKTGLTLNQPVDVLREMRRWKDRF